MSWRANVRAVSAAGFLVAASFAVAAETSETVRIKGQIKITGSEGTRVTSAAIQAASNVEYRLVMDVRGEDLAKVMFGQTVDIRAAVTEKNGVPWLRVTCFSEEKHTEAHELWRRSRCNACAVQRGAEHAAAPRDPRGAAGVTGRLHPCKQQFRSATRDNRYLWLATDALIQQIDLPTRRIVRVYDRTSGLPSAPIVEIASDNATLWIVCRGSAAALPIGSDRAIPLPVPRFAFAKLCLGNGHAWVIADRGTYRLARPDDTPAPMPAIPTGERMRAEIERGMWLPMWKRDTAFYATDPVAFGDRLYVGSFGNVYELADGAWKEAIRGGFATKCARDRIWVLTSGGLVELDPRSGTSRTHAPAAILDGRPTAFAVTDDALWMTAEPNAAPQAGRLPGGGIARMRFASGEWQVWKRIGDRDATHAVLAATDNGVWAVTHEGAFRTLAAHPGMTYVKKTLFETTGFVLHQWEPRTAEWVSLPLACAPFERRYICGQDGAGADGTIGPQEIAALCVGADRVFAVARLLPQGNFSGFWPCVEEIARRGADGAWTAGFRHRPEALNLQGEQPAVLNISNKGELVLEAVGHDSILDLFLRDGTPWVVTEGCAAWYDRQEDAWRSVTQLGFNFYWRVTAVCDEGDSVYLGSDRGFVSRFDGRSGRCAILGGLKDRAIASIRREGGRLLARGAMAPLGVPPVALRTAAGVLDADAAWIEGDGLVPAANLDAAPASAATAWEFRPAESTQKSRGPFQREQFIGNLLWGPSADGHVVPQYYIKEVYSPRFLGFSEDRTRLWLSTFTGLLKVDLPAPPR